MNHVQQLSSDYSQPLPTDDIYAHQPESFRELWEAEYGRHSTIPSTRREAPAHALVQLFKNYELRADTALDLGCGNGRNAFYLAAKGINVVAVDFSQTALDLLEKERKKQNLSAVISSMNHDIREGLPLAPNSMDLILDSYCLCHFIDSRERRKAIAEMHRILKPGGKLIKIHLDNRDEYYLERQKNRAAYGHISYDPANGLSKTHMSLQSYLQDIGPEFKHVTHENVKFIDDVRGASYERSIFVCVTEK